MKEIVKKAVVPKHTKPDKRQRVIAGAIAVLSVALGGYTAWCQKEDYQYLILSAVILTAILVIGCFSFSFHWILEIVAALPMPIFTFILVENYTHDPWYMNFGPCLLNYLLYYGVFLVILFIFGRIRAACALMTIIFGVAGLANYFVILFRSSPILPWDILSVGTAAAVSDNVTLTFTYRAYNVVLLFALQLIISLKFSLKLKKRAVRIGGTAAAVALCLGACVFVQRPETVTAFGMYKSLFVPTVFFGKNGFLLSFTYDLQFVSVDKPEGYNVSALEKASGEVVDQGADEAAAVKSTEESPNIIVVMNETFSDLSVLSDFETNVDYMPYIHAMSENTQKGWMYSSVKGGNTANSEFEFLTNNSMAFLPLGSVVYQQYLTDYMPSLVSQMNTLGYTTVGMHPYYPAGWNRSNMYDLFGFNEKYFIDDFYMPEIVRKYISDWSTYEKIIDLYEDKDEDEKLFVFDVTMQNHSSYLKQYYNFKSDVDVTGNNEEYIDSLEQYLSLIKLSDESFGKLIDYFKEADEPTVILMFGDHQPTDYVVTPIYEDTQSDDVKTSQDRYIVPYVLWANYDIETSKEDVTSANYLNLKLLEAAGIPFTPYQTWLSELSEILPVVTGNMYIDNEGTYYARDDIGFKELLHQYALYQYNDLVDSRNRIEGFFEYLAND